MNYNNPNNMKYLITICAILCSFYSLSAQPGQWESYIRPDRAGEVLEEEETLWVPTTAGLLEINKNTGEQQLWNKANSALLSNSIEGVAQHPLTKDIFIGTYDLALMVKEDGSDEWEHLPYPASITQSSGQMIRTYCLEFDAQGVLWVGTDLGLLRYDGVEWEVVDADNNTFLGAVWDIQSADNGKMYVSSHGLFELEDENLNMISPEGAVEGQFLFGYGYSTAHLFPDNTLWFFTDVGSCGYYDGETWSQMEHIPGLSFTGSPYSFWQNDDGVLQVFVPGRDLYEHTEEGWMQAEGWNNAQNVIRVAELDNGDQLLITDEVLLWEDGTVQEYTDYPFRAIPFRFEYDNEERLWVIDSNGILLNVAEGESFIVQDGEDWPAGFSEYTFAPDGSLWYLAGRQVHHYDNGSLDTYDYTNSDLPDQFGYRLLEVGPDGSLWLSVHDAGIYHFQNGEWQLQDYPAFQQNYIVEIEPSPEGLWVAMIGDNTSAILGLWNGTSFEQVLDGESGYLNNHLNELQYSNGRLWALGYRNLQYLEEGNWVEYALPFEPGDNDLFLHMILREDRMILHSRYSIWIEEAGNWQTITADNSPMDQERITEVGLDPTGDLWITHSNKPLVDRYSLGVLNSLIESESPAKFKTLNVIGNPVTGDLIQLQMDNEPNNSLHVMIFDAAGRRHTVQLQSVQGSLLTASTNGLIPGWYTVVIESEGERYLASFIRQ